jgi:hypothetical protein
MPEEIDLSEEEEADLNAAWKKLGKEDEKTDEKPPAKEGA